MLPIQLRVAQQGTIDTYRPTLQSYWCPEGVFANFGHNISLAVHSDEIFVSFVGYSNLCDPCFATFAAEFFRSVEAVLLLLAIIQN